MACKEIIADRILRMADSQTLVMTHKSRILKEKGIDVINMSIGEPDFNSPQVVKEAAKKAIDDNFSHYSPIAGFPDLITAIIEKLRRENNLDYKANQIVVSNGAKQSLANTIFTIVDHGDEVLIPIPFWVSYTEVVKMAGGKPVLVPSNIENNFKVTAEQIEKHITDKTKVIILNSPSNPTGSIYSKEELIAIKNVLVKHEQIFIISDEIYEHINFGGQHESFAQFDELKCRTILINGVSKAFAMTGWRIGYLAAPEWIAKAVIKLQGQITSGASSIAQKASVAALNHGIEFTSEMKKVFLRRRDLVLKKLAEIPGIKFNVPDGAFYVFPEIDYYFGKKFDKWEVKNSTDLSLYLLETVHVAVVPGSAFGDDNYIRISYAASDEELIKALDRIKLALQKLQ